MANKRITDLDFVSGDSESGDFLLSSKITNTGNWSLNLQKKDFDDQLTDRTSGDIFANPVTDISGNLDSLDGRISANDGDISDLDTASGILDNEVSSLENRMSDLQNTGANLETQFSDIDDSVGALDTATGVLENRTDQLEISTGLLSDATGSLQSRNVTEQGELPALNTTWSNIDEALSVLETKSGELSDAISYLRSRVPDAENPLLETHGGAAAAYSLRSLNTGESPVVRVRRASDNSESDFTANEIDNGELEAFCNAGDPNAPTGGTISVITDPNDGKIYRVHTFTNVGTSSFETPVDLEVEYLIVAGGGAGGSEGPEFNGGGGGGAGGFLTGQASITSQEYNVIVGAGGSSVSQNFGENGEDSSIANIATAIGGGGGANYGPFFNDGKNGGSGGGGRGNGSSGGLGIAGQGNNGGAGSSSGRGGGGGGAGAAGQDNTTSSKIGNGGDGLPSSITGETVFYAGGGVGSDSDAVPGLGGGGAFKQNGSDGLGGGGGGTTINLGGNGGSGIVIIRYELTNVIADGFVTTWYDQSGNGNDATQTTAANQPKIVDNGSIITNNGINCLQSIGSDDSLLITGLDISDFTAFGVLSAAGSASAWEIYSPSRRILSPTSGYGFWQDGNAISYSAPDLVELHTALYVNGSVEIFYNGTSAGSDINTPITNSENMVLLNDFSRGNENSRLSEIILYSSDQSKNRTAIEANINAYYDIFPQDSIYNFYNVLLQQYRAVEKLLTEARIYLDNLLLVQKGSQIKNITSETYTLQKSDINKYLRIINKKFLELFPNAAAAYSLRDLNDEQNPVVRVRRYSDNSEKDFTANEINNGLLVAWTQSLPEMLFYDPSRDVGYMGEVATSDFINGDDLAAEFSLTAGTSQNSTAGWLKFYVGPNAFCNRQGNAYALYVAKRTMRHTVSWNDINGAGLVDGSSTIDIGGTTYSVRLMQGADDDPSTYGNPVSCSDNAGGGSEWNELMYRVSEQIPDCSNPNEGMEGGGSTTRHGGPQNGSNWANFTNSELNVQVGSGRFTWCQEVDGTISSRRVVRGFVGVADFYVRTSSIANSSRGWRPCLQLDLGPTEGNVSAFVTTWYDQSGNGNDATQTTASAQPKIVDNGVLVTENGKAALEFDGNAYFISNLLDISQPITGFIVTYKNPTVANIFDSSPERSIYGDRFGSLITGIRFGVSLTDGNDYLSSAQILSVFLADGNNSYLYTNTSLKLLGYAGENGISDLWIGGKVSSSAGSYNGTIQEIILYPSDQSSNRTAIENNINSYYNIY